MVLNSIFENIGTDFSNSNCMNFKKHKHYCIVLFFVAIIIVHHVYCYIEHYGFYDMAYAQIATHLTQGQIDCHAPVLNQFVPFKNIKTNSILKIYVFNPNKTWLIIDDFAVNLTLKY